MDRRAQTTETTAAGNSSAQCGPDPSARAAPQPSPGSPLNAGGILVKTLRHFWPDFNQWLDEFDDPRRKPLITYDLRFLAYWGLSVFLFKLGSRRHLDYPLSSLDTEILDNLNRLAGTEQTSRPVHNTLNNLLGRLGLEPWWDLRTKMMQRLVRRKVFDDGRLQGRHRVIIDGTGVLWFRERHCPHCLTQKHGATTVYLHQVLEAKLVGPDGMVLSLATEFEGRQNQGHGSRPQRRTRTMAH